MGYRIHKPKPKPRLHRTLVDHTTPSKVFVQQGVRTYFAVPCWYQEVHRPVPVHIHDTHMHDYIGWPSPMHPGHSCQFWAPDLHDCTIGHQHECSPHCRHFLDLANVYPIHLLEEGYDATPSIYLDGVLAYSASSHNNDNVKWADIDEDEDWVIRFALQFDDCEDEPEEHDVAIFVTRPQGSLPDDFRRDLVMKAKIVVTPVLALPE